MARSYERKSALSNSNIVIIDYKMGNLHSIQKAFKKVDCNAIISNDIEVILKASKLVLPGVGAFKDGMKHLDELNLINILSKKVLEDKTPILGICLGMQLLSNKSYENGETIGLGWIDAEVIKFDFDTKKLKIPHVGWNELYYQKENCLFNNIQNKSDFYFVHSYHFKTDEDIVLTTTDYGFEFVSAINRDNIYGTQFHPEKSQSVGLQLINNFVNL